MDSRSRFRPRLVAVEAPGDRGTKGERPGGWPFNRVGGNPETGVRGERRKPTPESSGVDTQEKPGGEVMRCPYRKPTQVGKASSLR